jgi:hypothetical protein
MKTLSSLTALALAAGAVGTVEAQTATIAATARVLSPIVVSTTEDLRFGDVLQGTSKAVLASNANSGQFEFSGSTGAQVDMVLTLPTNLSNGGTLMPINTWSGLQGVNATRVAGTGFVPTTGTSMLDNLGAGAGDVYRIFVGATVVPGAVQAVGNYTAPIDLQVTYTGN